MRATLSRKPLKSRAPIGVYIYLLRGLFNQSSLHNGLQPKCLFSQLHVEDSNNLVIQVHSIQAFTVSRPTLITISYYLWPYYPHTVPSKVLNPDKMISMDGRIFYHQTYLVPCGSGRETECYPDSSIQAKSMYYGACSTNRIMSLQANEKYCNLIQSNPNSIWIGWIGIRQNRLCNREPIRSVTNHA